MIPCILFESWFTRAVLYLTGVYAIKLNGICISLCRVHYTRRLYFTFVILYLAHAFPRPLIVCIHKNQLPHYEHCLRKRLDGFDWFFSILVVFVIVRTRRVRMKTIGKTAGKNRQCLRRFSKHTITTSTSPGNLALLNYPNTLYGFSLLKFNT